MTSAWTTGLLTGLALIVAIGTQNAFILRQGIRREHVGVVVAICIVSDILLISAGTLGIGWLVARVPWALVVLRWVGVVYLVAFAVRSLRAAFTPQHLEAAATGAATLRSVALTTVALTWVNPHLYLDVIMLGNLANQHGAQRWAFTGGTITASVLWFTALGTGARALSTVLNTPLTWRIIDVLVGVVILAVAVTLALTPAL